MPVITELKAGRFAINLGEAVEFAPGNNRALAFKRLGANEYEMTFKINFKTKKEFVAGSAANKIGPTEGSLAVLSTDAIVATQVEVPQFKFYFTKGGEMHLELDVKVPGGEKGNHGN